jgi:hypothetical protein
MFISKCRVLIEGSILWDLPVLQAAHAVWWHIQQHGDCVFFIIGLWLSQPVRDYPSGQLWDVMTVAEWPSVQ